MRTSRPVLFHFPSTVRKQVLRAAQAALKIGRLIPGEINLILLDDDKMRKVNRQFRKADRKTDVLTFRYSSTPLEGDIFLSKGVSKRQAKEQGHPWADELAYLAIHGILHLFGYTDYSQTAKKKMFAIQDKIFAQLIK